MILTQAEIQAIAREVRPCCGQTLAYCYCADVAAPRPPAREVRAA